MIFITGDTHGIVDIHKLSASSFIHGKNMTKEDYVIILGDFALLWYPEGNEKVKQDNHWLDWLDAKPWTTLFLDGNHENHSMLYDLLIIEKFGGKVGQVRDSIFHLKRGEVYEIDYNKFFVMGGAYSIDKLQRIEGISWWKEEEPSHAEYEYGLSNLEKNNWEVDYILGHTCPGKIGEEYLKNVYKKDYEIMMKLVTTEMSMPAYGGSTSTSNSYLFNKMDGVSVYFNKIVEQTKFKKFYFGHWHDNWYSRDEKYVMLYNDILLLGETLNYNKSK